MLHAVPIVDWLRKQITNPSGAYLVGGSVRDLLLGRPVADLDVAVAADAGNWAAALAGRLGGRMVRIGKPGKMIHRVVSSEICIDVAPARGSTMEEDLRQRDFSINAMALSLETGELIDISGGRDDLAEGVVAMVAENVFQDDPVRLLRAYRFAAELNFQIHPETAAAISRQRGKIRKSAGERVWGELEKFLACPNAHGQLARMRGSGLLFDLIPELEPLPAYRKGRHHGENVLEQTLRAFGYLEKLLPRKTGAIPWWIPERNHRVMLKLAVLLHGAEKPNRKTLSKDGDMHFHAHDRKGATPASPAARRFRLSKRKADLLAFFLSHHDCPRRLFDDRRTGEISKQALVRFFRKSGDHFPGLILLSTADVLSRENPPKNEYLAFGQRLFEAYQLHYRPKTLVPRLLDGNDLIETCRLRPSPFFRRLLDAVEEARLAGDIRTREEALAMVHRLIRKEKPISSP